MTQVYCDTSNLKDIKKIISKYRINGVTTNPSIMRNDGVTDYKRHCLKINNIIGKKRTLSVEVFSNKKKEILKQAYKISKWADNIYVKIPIVNTDNTSLNSIIKILNENNIKINITAVFVIKQIDIIKRSVNKITPIIISIFSGRIADCGVDPDNVVRYAIKSFKNFNNVKILWASTREVFNYYQAKNLGCHIITMSPDLIHKFYKKKIALDIYSLQTVRQFFLDGKKSKFEI